MQNDEEQERMQAELAARNRRLAIALALMAVAIYVLFVLGYS